MSVSVTVNGVSYTIPTQSERGWASAVTSWIQSVSLNTLQKSGGTFTLTADVDFGATYGVKAAYHSTRSSNPSGSGIFRLSNAETIGWRNAANSGNLLLTVNASDQLTYNGVVLSGSSALTASRAMATDASGYAAVSTVTTTELQRLSGIASAALGATDTQTVSGKTFADALLLTQIATPSTPASGYTKVYPKSDDKLYFLNDAGVETQVGAGSSSGINYCTNSDAETDTTGWTVYADAAGATPVNGAGVWSAGITFTRTTTTPLRGVGSFLLTKDAVNRQGQGAVYAFTIADADKAKPINISFEYNISSTAVAGSDSATGDINVYVYDVTNSTVIQPTPFKLPGGTGSNWKYSGTFQTSSTSTSYRLLLHVAGTNSTATTYYFDTVVISPQVQLYGAPVTDWTSYTGTITSPTNVTGTGWWRREGDAMRVRGSMTWTGAGGSASLTFSLPSPYLVDSTKGTFTSNVSVVGEGNWYDSGTDFNQISVLYNNGNNVVAFALDQGSGLFNSSACANGDIISFEFLVPILGWGSNVVMSQDADTRVVAARYEANASVSLLDVTAIVFANKIFDTHNAFSSNTYTVPVAGTYVVSAGTQTVPLASGGITRVMTLWVYKNGSRYATIATTSTQVLTSTQKSIYGTTPVSCVAGDTISVYFGNDDGATTSSAIQKDTFFSIHRLSGPATIAASELVACLYESNTIRSISNNSATTGQFLMEDRVFDTHGAYSTSTAIFTCPASGKYRATAMVALAASGSWDRNEVLELYLYKNGSLNRTFAGIYSQVTNTLLMELMGSTLVSCVAGDTLEVRVFQNCGAAIDTDATAQRNWVSYERIGI